jgi:hypothetical protein
MCHIASRYITTTNRIDTVVVVVVAVITGGDLMPIQRVGLLGRRHHCHDFVTIKVLLFG